MDRSGATGVRQTRVARRRDALARPTSHCCTTTLESCGTPPQQAMRDTSRALGVLQKAILRRA